MNITAFLNVHFLFVHSIAAVFFLYIMRISREWNNKFMKG